MEKLESIIAKIDLTSTGKLQRYIFGKPGTSPSGAVYLSKDTKLPCELTLSFLAGEKLHNQLKEVEDEE
jgi:hypothetical protein